MASLARYALHLRDECFMWLVRAKEQASFYRNAPRFLRRLNQGFTDFLAPCVFSAHFPV